MGARTTVSLRHATATYLSTACSPTPNGLLRYISEIKDEGTGLEAAKEPLKLIASLVHCGNQPINLDLDAPGLTVLDFSQIIDRSLCKLLVELCLQALWNTHTLEQPPLILILDEAHQLNWGVGSMSIRILREGRKFGIGGWFTSQYLDHKDAVAALGQAAMQAYFRPSEQHVQKLAKQFCSSRPSDLPQCQQLLQRLRRGQFLLQRPDGKLVVVCVES